MDQIRPYCKIISLATNASGQLGLYDTRGLPLFADFITVAPALGTASGTGYFWVQPSGLRGGPVTALQLLTLDPSSTNLSGAVGVVGTPGETVSLLQGPGADSCSAVQIVNRLTNAATPMTFLVNYGVRREVNQLRANTVSAGI